MLEQEDDFVDTFELFGRDETYAADRIEAHSTTTVIQTTSKLIAKNNKSTCSGRQHNRLQVYNHFGLRKRLKDMQESIHRWREEAYECQATLTAVEMSRFEEAVVLSISPGAVDAPTSATTAIQVEEKSILSAKPTHVDRFLRLRRIRMHIVSAIGGATATTLAFRMFAGGFMTGHLFGIFLCTGFAAFAVAGRLDLRVF